MTPKTFLKFLFAIFFGITVFMFFSLIYIHQPETKSADEKILIKKVEIVPSIFRNEESVALKLTLDRPVIRCKLLFTRKILTINETVVYCEILHSSEKFCHPLFLIFIHPERKYFLCNPDFYWDIENDRCNLMNFSIKYQ